MRTHGEAQQMRALDAGMIHEGKHIARHRLAIVLLGFVQLGALAMAAAIESEAAQSLAGDGVVPAHALPVLVAVGRETVHQHHGLGGIAGSEFVIGEREPVRSELSHNFP